MLKIFFHKLRKVTRTECDKYYQFNNNLYYPPISREWYNSIYTFNKNTIKSLPMANKLVLKIIKSYFNLYSIKLERKVNLHKLRRWMRRLSIKRVFINKIGLKHTNDKVIITIYVYNKQKIYFINKIKKLFKRNIFFDKVTLVKEKLYNILYKIRSNRNMFLYTLNWNIDNFKEYENRYSIKFINKYLRYMKIHIYYKQLLLLNKFKLKNSFIYSLKILIEKIYNKEVEFNLVSLKYFYTDPDIYLQILTLKLKNRNNRIYKILNKSLKNIKLPLSHELILYSDKEKINNLYLNKLKTNRLHFFTILNEVNDILNNALFNIYKLNLQLPIDYKNIVLNSIKYKIFSGIKIEATGRLSKRLIAARTIFKSKYIGNLRDSNFSYKGITSSVLRGNIKSNINYAKLGSKTKIGSYGLKSWINNT